MPRTVDHIVEMHTLAQSRRNQGKPVWEYHLTAPRRDDDFEWNRDQFATALRNSRWMKASLAAVDEEWDSELFVLWDEIKDAEDVDHFNVVLDQIYDLADFDRCWISFERQ